MSTPAQINANIKNAQASTGPRSDTGKAVSSKNSVVFGLFSGDFVRPGEERAYTTLHVALKHELTPVGALEETLVDEVQRAAWRLRRCGEVESNLVIRLNDGENYILDPMEGSSPQAERIQKSVDRARSQAHRLLHKCTAELRKLQSERKNNSPSAASEPGNCGDSSGSSSAEPVAQRTQSESPQTPRNAPCPCGSGQKHKRCCGKNAPAMLNAA